MGIANILLLGGNGFLGSGLRDEFSKRGLHFRSVDIDEIDLSGDDAHLTLKTMLKDVTHVVILAAKIGRVIFTERPEDNAKINQAIFAQITTALAEAHNEYGLDYDVTFYSTSEIYGSLDSKKRVISGNSKANITYNGRGLYASQKLNAELSLISGIGDNGILRVKTIRPFNVSGKHQRRGVVYEMVKSAFETGSIWFSDDTYRSFTSIEYASRIATDIILSDDIIVEKNLSENLTFSMEEVASLIKEEIGDDDLEIVRKEPDMAMRYRQTSLCSTMGDDEISKMRGIISDVISNYMNEAEHD